MFDQPIQTLLVGTLAAAAALALAANTARAEGEPGGVRAGATFAVGLGGGQLGCTNGDGDPCTSDGPAEAGTAFVEAGAMLSPRLALVGHLAIAAHRDGDITVSQTILAAALRGWAIPRLWLEGGLGIAQARFDYDGALVDIMSESDTVPAVIGGVGYEVLASDRFALDVHLRAGTGLYRDDVRLYQVSLGVGASFF